MPNERAPKCNASSNVDSETPTSLPHRDTQIQNKISFKYENDWSFLERNISLDLYLALEECKDAGKETNEQRVIKPDNLENKPKSLNIPKSSAVSMIPTGNSNMSILSNEVSSLSSSKQDSIVDLYCDDELRMSLEFDDHHLGLGLSEELAVYDLLDDDLLPTSVTTNLEESLDELAAEWESSDCVFGRDIVTPTGEEQ